jgi:hypothetical protein
MGTLRVPFNIAYEALMASGISDLRCYIPYNRKQKLSGFRQELGLVFVDDKPLHDADTIIDFGVSWRVPGMFVFGLLQTSLLKNCKVHSMHLCAGKGAGSLEFEFTDKALKGIKACIYPEAARFVKASKRCAHTPVFTREAFRNQAKGQKMIVHLIIDMLQREDLARYQGYRIEYRITHAKFMWEAARDLQQYSLFSWKGLKDYLGDSVERMDISKDFVALLPKMMHAAKALVWNKEGIPSELDRRRMIELWHMFGLHSGWQRRSDTINLHLKHWVARRPISSPEDQSESDRLEANAMANVLIPPGAWLELEKSARIRSCCKGCRVSVTLKNNGGKMWKTFVTTTELFAAIYDEWGDNWKTYILTKNTPANCTA